MVSGNTAWSQGRRSNLSRVVWIFCPGHAGVAGNERAYVLAGEAGVGEPIILDPPTVMAALTRVAAERGFSPFEFLSILVEVFRVKRNYSSPGYNIIPARI